MEKLYLFRNILRNFLLFTFLFDVKNFVSASCQGCVELDVITFDKLLAKFNYSLIKFDIAFPYGEKHEDFGTFAKEYAKQLNSELLIGLVGIKDYGEKDNSELGEKYSVDKEKYPEILIFKNKTLIARWPENVNINYKNIKDFVRNNTDLYIGLHGCVKDYDELVEEFMQSTVLARKLLCLDTVYYRSKHDQGNSLFYLKYMTKIFHEGQNVISEEMNRLKKILNTKLSSNKKNEIKVKINILNVFEKYKPKEDNSEEISNEKTKENLKEKTKTESDEKPKHEKNEEPEKEVEETDGKNKEEL